MITRSTLYSSQGGDTIQAQQTARTLRENGVTVDIRLCDERIDYNNYHLLHFFNITRPADIVYHIRKAKKPFVVSTIFMDYSEYDRHHRSGLPGIIFRCFNANSIEYAKSLARWIRGRDKMVSLSYLWKGQQKSIREIIQKATLLLPNSISEYGRLNKLHGCNTKYLVVHNGVDEGLFRPDATAIRDPKLIICVARIEGIKNQLNLIRALNNTDYQLLIIGAPSPNQQSYYSACRRIAASNISFIEHVPQEKLVSYYQKAKVHALPSWFETTGLSSLEGAAMGCNVVITDKGYTREYFGDHAEYCDPGCVKSIHAAVERAAALPCNEQLQHVIRARYTWKQAGLSTTEGYKRVIQATWD